MAASKTTDSVVLMEGTEVMQNERDIDQLSVQPMVHVVAWKQEEAEAVLPATEGLFDEKPGGRVAKVEPALLLGVRLWPRLEACSHLLLRRISGRHRVFERSAPVVAAGGRRPRLFAACLES